MTTTTGSTATRTARGEGRQGTAGGLLLGVGLGGFVDGIVLHQLLQWHHMLTDYGEHTAFPSTTVDSLEANTFWDGMFHTGTWVSVTVGVFLLWRAVAVGHHATWRCLTGLLLAGWGLFNLVEGIVDHHILTLHHVRDDVADPLWWDLGFLALGALLLGLGLVVRALDGERTAGDARASGAVDERSPARTNDA